MSEWALGTFTVNLRRTDENAARESVCKKYEETSRNRREYTNFEGKGMNAQSIRNFQ